MKKILLILTGCAALCSLLYYAFWAFLNSSYIGDLLANKCQEISGSVLKFKKNPKISIFPATFSMEDISWQSPGNDPAIFFSARLARVSLDLFSLLNDQPHIREIYIDEGKLRIIDKGSSAPAPASYKKDAKGGSASAEKLPFLLDRLVLHHSAFSYGNADLTLWLSQLNATAEHFGPRQETDLKCDFIIANGPANSAMEAADLQGNMAIRTKLRYYAPNLTFRQTALTFTGTKGAGLIWLSPLALEAEGSLNLKDLSIHLNSSQLRTAPCQFMLNGDYIFGEDKFSGHISMDFNLNQSRTEAENDNINYDIVMASPVQYGSGVLNFPDIAISSGTSRGSGNLRLILPGNSNETQLLGKLNFGFLNLPRGKKEDKDAARADASAKAGSGAQDFAWPHIDLSFSAAGINYERFAGKDIHFQLQGRDGVYMLKDLGFGWASGKAEGSGQVNMKDQSLLLKTEGKDVNIGKALWELGIDGFQGGAADFDANLSISGFDSQSIKKSLDGDFNFTASHVKISLLEEMIKFLSRFSQKAALLPNGIDLFSVKARAQNGMINLNPLLLQSKEFNASAQGDINLATDELNASLELKIFGMTLPVSLGGKLSHPSWRIEPAWFKRLW